jgi:ubiquitin-protein ligase
MFASTMRSNLLDALHLIDSVRDDMKSIKSKRADCKRKLNQTDAVPDHQWGELQKSYRPFFGDDQQYAQQRHNLMAEAHKEEARYDASIGRGLNDLSTAVSNGELTKSLDDAKWTMNSLKESLGLKWVLATLLRNQSLLDIGSRAELYKSLLSFLSALAYEPYTAPYLTLPLGEDIEESCYSLLGHLSVIAATFIALQCSSSMQFPTMIDLVTEQSLSMAQEIMNIYSRLEGMTALAKESGILQELGLDKISQSTAGTSTGSQKKAAAAAAVAESWSEREQRDYVARMKGFRFKAVELCGMVSTGQIGHAFYPTACLQERGISANPQHRLRRIAAEMAGLSSSLPIEHGSSIFVRCDDDRMDILKALIIGPEETPYANGCFEFDIFLPPDYPNSPPKVQLETTGRGRVRFNPNLYNCGKVCLSLLGTWSGPGWDPANSTLLQVLVSIQSLILVPDPYFNEPGFERERGTPIGKVQSDCYNENIRRETLRYAIIEPLNTPSPLFKDVIQEHFKAKQQTLHLQLDSWSQITQNVTQLCETARGLVSQLNDSSASFPKTLPAPQVAPADKLPFPHDEKTASLFGLQPIMPRAPDHADARIFGGAPASRQPSGEQWEAWDEAAFQAAEARLIGQT